MPPPTPQPQQGPVCGKELESNPFGGESICAVAPKQPHQNPKFRGLAGFGGLPSSPLVPSACAPMSLGPPPGEAAVPRTSATGGPPTDRGHHPAETGLDQGPPRGQPGQAPAAWQKANPGGKFPRGKIGLKNSKSRSGKSGEFERLRGLGFAGPGGLRPSGAKFPQTGISGVVAQKVAFFGHCEPRRVII